MGGKANGDYLNACWLEEYVLEKVANRDPWHHSVLMCSAVNAIDASGLKCLEAINRRLSDGSVKLHMSEVEGPGKDWLKRANLFDELSGRASLSQDQALVLLANDTGQEPDEAYRMLARGLI